MALTYYLYSTGTTYANTVISGSSTSFVPLPSGTSEVQLDFDLKYGQPYYIYQYTGGTELVANTKDSIKYYRIAGDDPVELDDFINTVLNVYEYFGITQPTAREIVDGEADTVGQLIASGFTSLSGETERLDDLKIEKVTGATGNLAIFKTDGNVEDSGVTIEAITGGSGFYYYIEETGLTTNITTTDVVYLSGDSSTLQGGTWSVDFSSVAGNQSRNKSINIGFYIDDVLQGVRQSYETNAANNRIFFGMSKDLTLTAGIHRFSVRFNAPDGGTAEVDYASIRARQVQ